MTSSSDNDIEVGSWLVRRGLTACKTFESKLVLCDVHFVYLMIFFHIFINLFLSSIFILLWINIDKL